MQYNMYMHESAFCKILHNRKQQLPFLLLNDAIRCGM